MDFPQVAMIVGAHTESDFTGSLDESAIVYLADKLVRGEEVVSIDQRFQLALTRFSNRPLALRAALNRKAVVKAVAKAVEDQLGAPLASVVSEAG
jgi:hypothetical protein